MAAPLDGARCTRGTGARSPEALPRRAAEEGPADYPHAGIARSHEHELRAVFADLARAFAEVTRLLPSVLLDGTAPPGIAADETPSALAARLSTLEKLTANLAREAFEPLPPLPPHAPPYLVTLPGHDLPGTKALQLGSNIIEMVGALRNALVGGRERGAVPAVGWGNVAISASTREAGNVGSMENCGRIYATIPAESASGTFGGNSNWCGPIWFPLNFLILRGLLQFYAYLEDAFTVECPTGSGQQMTLFQVVQEIGRRLTRIFLRDEHGRRPVYGGAEKFQTDPHWRDYLLFYEYFHGDNGAGIGASHQTGWTGLVARLIHGYASLSREGLLERGSGPAVFLYGTREERPR